ncbi:MAG: hypothetical protein R6X02_00890 [Enhygromyxa sp.]
MSISSLIGSRLVLGLSAFALSGSLVGSTAMAAKSNHPVQEIRHEVRDQSKAQREEIKQLRAEFAAEFAKDQPDADKLEQLQAAMDAKRAEISDLRFAALMKMHDELDAEQRARMAEKLAGKADKGERGKAKANKAERGKAKANKGERGKAKADGKGKPDVASKATADKGERGKAKADGKGKPDMASKAKAKTKAERAPI